MEDYTIKNIYSSLKLGIVATKFGLIISWMGFISGLFLCFIINLSSIF